MIRPLARRAGRKDDDRGIAAVITAILMPVIFGMCALTIDVGAWYVTAGNVQRAADAAALAGAVYLPGDLTSAKAQALVVATQNGYTTGGVTTVDPEPVPGQPSQLKVTITTTIDNTFGQLLGKPNETIIRSAVATYQAPLPLGSPCNEFGNGPDPLLTAVNVRSSNCSSAGQFWANVGSPKAPKSNGDAYQDNNCSSSAAGTDFCTSSGNSEYSPSGYYYQVKLSHDVSGLTIQAFDPAFVSVGDTCTSNFGSGTTASTAAKNQYNFDPAKNAYIEDPNLYASGASSVYCTGDALYTGDPPDTTYTILAPTSTSSLYDPTTYTKVGGCTQTFTGYSGSLYDALNQGTTTTTVVGGKTVTTTTAAPKYRADVASEFRQWVTLCTIPGTVSAGSYFVQVQTNADGDNPNGAGHNRFALRAFGSNGSDTSGIAISGLTSMAMYANLPSAKTSFYLTQVPPGAAGQILDLRFFDIGDSSQPGTVTVIPPTDSGLTSFSGCVGKGPTTGALSNCSIPANSSYNGKWETISVPIPANYTCALTTNGAPNPTGCWITLTYNYGSGQPSDTTTWTATLEGTPVRIIQ